MYVTKFKSFMTIFFSKNHGFVMKVLSYPFVQKYVLCVLRNTFKVAAIAPWFRLRLPSCGPRFESQAHHQNYNLYY